MTRPLSRTRSTSPRPRLSALAAPSLRSTAAAIATLGAVLAAGLTGSTQAADAPAAAAPDRNLSFRHEVQHAIGRGLNWLEANQNSNGWWSTPDQPAVTALALTAAMGEPTGRYTNTWPAWVRRGYDFLLANAHPDGGIHRTNLVTYNTAISLTALMAANRPEFDPVALRARQFLVRLQRDFGEKGKTDDVFDGGIGYGSKYEHSDMGNTLAALEALHHSRRLIGDPPAPGTKDLNWAAAIQFLQNCQNLPSHNRQAWASDDPKHKGGFIYYPGHSMAGAETNAETKRVALRSYGSISYGGLLSYTYANLQRNDPRVTGVLDWLRRNYTLEENPGMGAQGLYYYLHTMTKALSAQGIEILELADGRRIDWRREVANRLINAQQKDGSWMNDNGRWWERDPALVTAYGVLSLELLLRGL